jgi:lysozyme
MNLVNWLNVGAQLAKQGKVEPHQQKALAEFNAAVLAGKPILEASQAFTATWRSVVQQAKPPDFWETEIVPLEQPDGVTCQSASIAMVLGLKAADIPKVRASLRALGDAGAPQVMAEYLKPKLGNRYSLHWDANLHEVIQWLMAGEALITHGFHTEAGHVFVLCGVDPDEKTGSVSFKVVDPYGKFNCSTWDFEPGARFYHGWVAAEDIYALCVVTGGVSSSRHAYRNSELDINARGMWVHRIKPVGTAPVEPAERQCNARGLEIIRQSEGYRSEAYLCPAGVWTLGYGSTTWLDGLPVRAGMSCTQEQAEKQFRKDVQRFERDVIELIGNTPTTENQFSALVSFAYNCGSDIDADSEAEGLGDSTLLRLHKAGKHVQAAAEFGKWVHGGGTAPLAGLVTRRAKERELYLS